MNEDRARFVEDLLRATEAAHAVYERDELAGVYDQAWPAWYAAYAVDHGLGRILGRDVAAEELATFLTSAWDAATQSDSKPAEPWSTWMARRIATEP